MTCNCCRAGEQSIRQSSMTSRRRCRMTSDWRQRRAPAADVRLSSGSRHCESWWPTSRGAGPNRSTRCLGQLLRAAGGLDSWGRQIRYGEAPTDPDVVTPFADGQPTTRSKVVQEALDLSNLIDDLESVEADSRRRERVIEQMPRSRILRRSPSLRKVPSLLWAHRTARRQHRREEELDQAVAAMKDEILENLRQQQVG